MKVTQIETLRLDEFPNVLWLRVHTDEGLIGLGKPFSGRMRLRPTSKKRLRLICSARIRSRSTATLTPSMAT